MHSVMLSTRSSLNLRLGLALARDLVTWLVWVVFGALVLPAVSHAQSNICNSDPVVDGSDFTSSAWTKSGPWEWITPNSIALYDDNGDATLTQDVQGVTPKSLVTFTWRFRNGVTTAGDVGMQSSLKLSYNGVVYWTGLTSGGTGSAPASTVSNGASCTSGCSGTLPALTDRRIQIRLPANVPINGRLKFEAQESGVTADDPEIRTPVSIVTSGICLVKNSRGGTGAFDFSTTGMDTTWGGGGTTASITTTAANTPTYYDANATRNDNQPLLVKNPGSSANVTITETVSGGFALDSVSCTGLTPTRSGNTITIANVPLDTVSTCTFNNITGIINLSKALGGNRASPNDNFSVAIRTGGVSGTVVNSTATSTTTGSGATVDSGTGTTGDFYTTPGTSYTLTEAGTSGANLSNYNAKLTCTDSTGVTPAASLPTGEAFDPAAGRTITPVDGANLRCVITNTSKTASIWLQKALGGSGRNAVSDQFTLSGSGSGAPAAVTTTGSGASITSSPYTFAATPGSTYVLNEAMAPGSISGLSQYTQYVRCSNVGPTDVRALTSLPIAVTPTGGDAISCVITNTPNGSGAPTQSNAICNADPLIAGNDFTNSAWTTGGTTNWDVVIPSRVSLTDDNGNAFIRESVQGVTPGALVTLKWQFRNGIISVAGTPTAAGNSTAVAFSYDGIIYWTGTTQSGLGNKTAASAIANGATCVSGCGSVAADTELSVTIRLPATVKNSGILQFTANTSTKTGAESDDIFIFTPLSVRNTGICLVKNSLGGTGKFNFTTVGLDTTWASTTNGTSDASITTPAANTPTYYDADATRDNSQPLLVKNPGSSANVTIAETPAAGFTLDSVSCDSGLTPTRSGNSISIANVPLDTVATCTFTNRTPIINLSKALGSNRTAANDNFSVAIRTGGANGGIVSSTANATTAGSGSTVTPGTGTTGDFQALPDMSYTLTEAGTSGTNLANYSAKLTCTDSAGVTPASSLPTNEAFDPAAGRLVTPPAGANLRCVITNTATTHGPILSGKVILDTGVGGGTAHDGVQNGTESGRAAVTVRLTDCGTTEFARTVTDANGNFALGLDTAVAGPVCLVKLPSTGFVAVSNNPGTTGGTYSQPNDTLQFTLTSQTSYSGIVFGEVPTSSLLTDGAKQAMPGTIVVYAHTFNAGTAATVTFSTSDSATGNAWISQLYRDNDCDAQLGPGDVPLAAPVTVTAGQVVCLLNKVSVPAGAPDGARDVTTVSAMETLTPAPASGPLSFRHSRTDTTTVALLSGMTLMKEVRRLASCPSGASGSLADGTAYTTSNSAKAGDAVEYRLAYRNDSSAAVMNISITDSMPVFTVFQGAWCLSTPSTGLTGCVVQSAPSSGATSGTIIWHLNDAAPPNAGLQPGAQGSVGFCVKVQQ